MGPVQRTFGACEKGLDVWLVHPKRSQLNACGKSARCLQYLLRCKLSLSSKIEPKVDKCKGVRILGRTPAFWLWKLLELCELLMLSNLLWFQVFERDVLGYGWSFNDRKSFFSFILENVYCWVLVCVSHSGRFTLKDTGSSLVCSTNQNRNQSLNNYCISKRQTRFPWSAGSLAIGVSLFMAAWFHSLHWSAPEVFVAISEGFLFLFLNAYF